MSIYDQFAKRKRNPFYDSSYMDGLNPEPVHFDNEDELRQIFATTTEEKLVLTNGAYTIDVTDDDVAGLGSTKAGSASSDDKKYFEAFVRLKVLRPDLPVWNVHSHPKGEELVKNLVTSSSRQRDEYLEVMKKEGKTWEDMYADQAAAGELPSRADTDMWYSTRHFTNGAIYHKDSDEFVGWSKYDENARGTKIAVAPHMARAFNRRTGQYEDQQFGYDLYLATETEQYDGVAYYDWDEWDDNKYKYDGLIDYGRVLGQHA